MQQFLWQIFYMKSKLRIASIKLIFQQQQKKQKKNMSKG